MSKIEEAGRKLRYKGSRWAAVLGVCPRCLGAKRVRYLIQDTFKKRAYQWLRLGLREGCPLCRGQGKWSDWMESRCQQGLAESLAWQLAKVKDAYWRDTGKPFEFERNEPEASQDRGPGHQEEHQGSAADTP